MRLRARVEDRVSIVGMCTPVLGLKNLEVGLVQTVVPLVSSSILSHCLAMVSSHARLRNQLWIFRLRILYKIDSIVIL